MREAIIYELDIMCNHPVLLMTSFVSLGIHSVVCHRLSSQSNLEVANQGALVFMAESPKMTRSPSKTIATRDDVKYFTNLACPRSFAG